MKVASVAPDGSPVELYRNLPSFGEAEIVSGAIAPNASVLELGCGTGRMTARLVERGHPVTAVDESGEMLSHVRDAETVQARIQDLDLERQFDCVLLASHLINAPDAAGRAALVRSCRRHVATHGRVLMQAYPADWRPQTGTTVQRGDVVVEMVSARWTGPLLNATVEYRMADRTWRHGPFQARVLTEDELRALLRRGGLEMVEWLDSRRSWFAAVPRGAP